jgi:hypothetical protein
MSAAALVVLCAWAPAAQPVADRVYGQPDFVSTTPNNPLIPPSNQLTEPRDVAVTTEGVYISDYQNNRVLFFPAGSTTASRVYGQDGFTTFDPNHFGLNEYSLSKPTGLAANATGLYVVDYRNTRVIWYPPGSTTAGRVYGQPNFGSSTPGWNGMSDASLTYPDGVAVDDAGGVYISDTGNARVLYYPPGSNVATKVWGGPDPFHIYPYGIGPDRFSFPMGLAVNNEGLYVVDYGYHRVLFFPTGSTVATRVYGQPDMYSGEPNNGGIGPNTLQQAQGVAVDGQGVYISDYLNSRVLYFEGTSTVASAVYGQPDFTSVGLNRNGVTSLGFYVPRGIACDATGLYACDSYNSRILHFPKQSAETAAGLSIVTQPAGAVAGQPLATQPIVEAVLTNGNVAQSYQSAVKLTLIPVSAPPYAMLTGATPITAVNGMAVFSGLTIDTPGTYKFRVTSATFPPLETGTFIIAPPSGTPVLGDINLDGSFNLADVVKLARIYAGLDTFPHG